MWGKNINLSVIMGTAFFTLGIVGFMIALLSFDSSGYDSKEMIEAAKYERLIYGIAILFGSGAIGAVLIALGRIQAALETISNKN